jgi:hypothetical protein
MSSQTKAIQQSAIRMAVAEAVLFLAVYAGVVGGVMYQVAVAAGYMS